ncbi:HAD-IA family hydrolase [Lachnospira rogosae (ex Hitch et al. 2025)]|uniref:HAD-IA family hydrolase n=1 Tax=[Lactobacillus] rogosae TaxID=706562 RepID=UPI0032BFF262
MVSGIIFDMDGVLIDSERQSNEGWLWAAGQLGVDMPMWLIDSFKGAPAELCCKFFDDYYKGVIDYWEAKELRTQHVYKIRETEGIPVKKGVKDIFEYIRNNGLKCAVATSTRRESAEKTLHEIEVWDYLDAVVYGDEVEHGKPEPDIFLRAAKAIGISPSEAVVVEDSINGIKAGYAAGMRVVHIPDTIAIDDDIRKLTYMVCDDLNGLIDVVESINKPAINRKNVINAFAEYVRNYDPSDEKIKLKIDHTYRVAGLCQRIAESLGLSEPDVDIAWLLGMLHDIGRFEQIRRFGTFNDAQSVDHAEFGADLLFKEGLIRKFAEGYYEECELARSGNEEAEQIIKNNEHHNKDTGLLELAIRQHNKYRVKEDLTERQRMFCDILRDADKVDIFKVNADIPMEIIYDVTTEELKNGVITKEVLESFYKKETVLKSVRRSAVDHIVGHISLLFELVYKESYRQAKEQGYVYKLLDFKSDVPEVNAEFGDMRKYVDEFLMEI